MTSRPPAAQHLRAYGESPYGYLVTRPIRNREAPVTGPQLA
ncbi:hypothetical protein [Actinomadura sp. HBU206391]|nr:hypothetical protein [Actinomadura sp. HBU206391]